MQPQAAYSELLTLARQRALLVSCQNLLEWDEETYMPPGGIEVRSRQRALLAGLIHERTTHPRMGELLGELAGSELVRDPLSPAAVNVRELTRDYERATRLPRSLVEETARVSALSQQEWAMARKASDYPRFEPWLAKMVALKRAAADALGYAEDPYDALLEDWEPGATASGLAPLFAELRRELVPLVASLAAAPRQPDESLLRPRLPF